MTILRIYTCACFSFFLFSIAVAQTPNMPFEIITETDGLSNHNVGAIVQDRDGYIWIGTGDGLNRFDGYSYKVFRKISGDSTSIQRNFITSLAIDHDGKIWIGFTPNGLSCYDPVTEKFTNYKHNVKDSTGIRESPVNRIFIDSKNNIWICCVKEGFYKFDRNTGKLMQAGPLPAIHPAYNTMMKRIYNHVNEIIEDEKGLFWMATSDGLYTFDPASGKFSSLRAKKIVPFKWRDDGFGSIVRDDHNRCWLGSWGGGLQSYNIKTGEWKMFKYHPENPQSGTDNLVHDVQLKNDSELWVGTGSYGLAVFNMNTEQYTFFNRSNPNLNMLNCWHIFIDKWSNKWFALNDGLGLLRANSSLFKFYTLTVTRTDNGKKFYISSILSVPEKKKIYMATAFADGLQLLNENADSTVHYDFKIRMDEGDFLMVTDLMRDSKGTLWVVTRDYVYTFDEKNNKLVLFPDQPPVDTSFKRVPFLARVFEDSSHQIWITTLRYGVYIYNTENKSFTHFRHDENNPYSLCSDNISDISEDKLHRVWLTSSVNGISVYQDSCKCFSSLVPDENDSTSLPGRSVNGINKNSKGDIWVSTYGGLGLSKIDAQGKISFRNYSYKEGIPSENVSEVICDNNDDVWFTTPAGLSRLDPVSGQVTTYTENDGLDKDYLAFYMTKASDGEIFIGTAGGYIRFNPGQLARKQVPPVVVINSVKVFDKNFPFREMLRDNKRIDLSWKENFFSFEFAALNFSEPGKNQFAYMLSGFDNDWIYCGNRRYASYTNLNGGDYVFRVKASDGDGRWSDNEISIPVHIELPLWKKTWFILLSVVIASLAIYVLYLYRISQVKHTEKLKTDFNRQLAQVEMRALRAQMNPHFIFNCLNSINRYIVKSDTKTASLYLTKFSRLIRLILENSENANVHLSSEIESLKLYIEMESLRFENKFTYEIKADHKLLNGNISIPPLIVQPYVENAIWHGLLNKEDSGKLLVEISKNNGSLQFIIEDNGVGRHKANELRSKSATERKSLGMKLTEERIAILNGHASEKSAVRIYDLEDENGKSRGTRVVITIHTQV